MAEIDGFEIDWEAAVPFALDGVGRRVHPQLCKLPWDSFECPFCLGEVTHVERKRQLRVGDSGKPPLVRRSLYFRHVRDTCHEPTSDYPDWRSERDGGGGGGESERHARIKRQLLEWLELEGTLELRHYCVGCLDVCIERGSLPDFDSADEEYLLRDCGRRVDLILLEGTRPVLAIEVKVTHGLERDKRAELGVPWIEIEDFDLRGERVLHVRASSNPRYCRKCAADFERGMSWWQEFAYGDEFEAYVIAELVRRFGNIPLAKLTPAFVRRMGAESCQRYESALEPHQRVARARELAQDRGVDLPPTSSPWTWYCRACCERMLVCYWPGREHGEAPPEQLSDQVVEEQGVLAGTLPTLWRASECALVRRRRLEHTSRTGERGCFVGVARASACEL